MANSIFVKIEFSKSEVLDFLETHKNSKIYGIVKDCQNYEIYYDSDSNNETFKPTQEQLNNLLCVLQGHIYDELILESLYNQLNKLI